MLFTQAIAAMTEPLPIDPTAVPDDAVVYALYGCVAVMAVFTAAYVFRTRPRKHGLRVVRRPR